MREEAPLTEPALLIAGHGSRDPEGIREFLQLVDLCTQREASRIVECGFLEFARPTIQEGIDRCVERGAKTISIVPGVLMGAGHAKNDIPSEVQSARRRLPDIALHQGRHFHLHAKIIELCRMKIEAAEHDATPRARRDTLLLVVGRGSSDPDANSDVQKLTRILWEGMGFGWGAACYIGITPPNLREALDRCHRLGFARMLVFPFFLFTGVLQKRIYRLTCEFAAAHPETELLGADYLDVHPLLVDVLLERAREAIEGSAQMNCDLCQYRVQLPGFEALVGKPQYGHHQPAGDGDRRRTWLSLLRKFVR
jgi:precorrin-8X/cobalt-precorrin-8 methylmutase